MEKIVDYLKQLDLSDVEAKLYLTLLQTGPTSVRDLAQTIDIKRTTAYFYIDQLVDKDLIMKLVKGSKKLVAANEPKNLEALVKTKLESAKAVSQGFPDILKTLNTTLPQKNNVNDAEIRYYKGKNGVKKIYEEALQANELRSFLNFEHINQALPDNGNLFVHALKNNENLIIHELFQDTPLSRKKVEESQTNSLNHKNYFKKFLPKWVSLSAADILIYDGHVGIVNVGNQFTGNILKNKDYYNNSKELFDLVWKVLPEIE
jgi:sugar-specific transcriptional regulator TrmB